MTATNVTSARSRHERERDRSACRQFLRLYDVEAYTGLKRTQIYKHIRKGEFPAPVALTDTGSAKAWDLAELEAWRNARLAARDAERAKLVPEPDAEPERKTAPQQTGATRPNTALLKRPQGARR
jgi:prophage regulatory protein